MKDGVLFYCLIGLGVWMGVSCSRLSTCKGAAMWAIFKGFAFGVFGWPLALPIIVLQAQSEMRRIRELVAAASSLIDHQSCFKLPTEEREHRVYRALKGFRDV